MVFPHARIQDQGGGNIMVNDVTKFHKCHLGDQGVLECVCVCVCAGFHAIF